MTKEQDVANCGFHQTHVRGRRHSSSYYCVVINALYVCVPATAITNTDSDGYEKKIRAIPKPNYTRLLEGLLMKNGPSLSG